MGKEKKEHIVAVEEPDENATKAHMGLFSGISMIVGLMVGAGIFATASPSFKKTGSVGVTLCFWALSGLLSTLGALCYVELGCAIPKSGGEHNYLLMAFGPYVAYSFDWTQSLLSLPLASAAMALVFAQYLYKVAGLEPGVSPSAGILHYVADGNDPDTYSLSSDLTQFIAERAIACGLIILLAFINILSARLGSKISDIFTVLKVGALVLIIAIGFYFLSKGSVGNFQNSFAVSNGDAATYGEALYQQLFAYSGWNNLNYMIDELKNPSRNLPLAIIISMTLVVTTYVLVNIAYFAVLPLNIISFSDVIGSDVGYAAFGFAGSVILTVCVVFSAIGAANANLFSNSRLIAASSEDGILFPTVLSKNNKKLRTPLTSLVFTALISCVYTLIPDLEILFNVFSFVTCVYTFLAVVGLFILRRTCPDLHRPFRVYTPIAVIFCFVSLVLIIYPLATARDMKTALPYILSVVIMLLPIPWIRYNLRKKGLTNSSGRK